MIVKFGTQFTAAPKVVLSLLGYSRAPESDITFFYLTTSAVTSSEMVVSTNSNVLANLSV
jgi:hypothetical protein